MPYNPPPASYAEKTVAEILEQNPSTPCVPDKAPVFSGAHVSRTVVTDVNIVLHEFVTALQATGNEIPPCVAGSETGDPLSWTWTLLDGTLAVTPDQVDTVTGGFSNLYVFDTTYIGTNPYTVEAANGFGSCQRACNLILSAPAVVPCPSNKNPVFYGQNITINLADDFGGGGYVTYMPKDVLFGVSPSGPHVPVCGNSSSETMDPLGWDFYLTSTTNALLTPNVADTVFNGLFDSFAATCADEGVKPVRLWAENDYGKKDFSELDITITDTLNVCP